MEQQTVLTPEQRRQIQESMQPWQRVSEFGLAIEQAVLQAPEVQALRKDAERYRLLRRGQKWSVIDGIGDALRAEVLDAAIDAAKEKQKCGD